MILSASSESIDLRYNTSDAAVTDSSRKVVAVVPEHRQHRRS